MAKKIEKIGPVIYVKQSQTIMLYCLNNTLCQDACGISIFVTNKKQAYSFQQIFLKVNKLQRQQFPSKNIYVSFVTVVSG